MLHRAPKQWIELRQKRRSISHHISIPVANSRGPHLRLPGLKQQKRGRDQGNSTSQEHPHALIDRQRGQRTNRGHADLLLVLLVDGQIGGPLLDAPVGRRPVGVPVLLRLLLLAPEERHQILKRRRRKRGDDWESQGAGSRDAKEEQASGAREVCLSDAHHCLDLLAASTGAGGESESERVDWCAVRELARTPRRIGRGAGQGLVPAVCCRRSAGGSRLDLSRCHPCPGRIWIHADTISHRPSAHALATCAHGFLSWTHQPHQQESLLQPSFFSFRKTRSVIKKVHQKY